MRCRIVIPILVAGAVSCASAQWLNYRDPQTPRTKDGKPNLSAPAPRASNGKPDLSGVWQAEPSPPEEFTRLFGDFSAFAVPGDDARTFPKYALNVLADFKPEEAPIRAAAKALFEERAKSLAKDFSTSHCLPGGITFEDGSGSPFPLKIVQGPRQIVVFYEIDGTHRQIYTDGRKHTPDPQPSWLGYSVGKWDADTLVVDTVGFNDKTWLDVFGHPHSEALHLTERFHRRDFGHMDLQITIDDPKMYTRPFAISYNERLLPDTDILETVCAENEKDRQHLAN
ncbi:MAG TPA: hypothetical protein VGR73_13625 [Bryobacteraceae bacterium]|nr:hypothetical protein [Bryobacteraceae bacterium]